ncbi:hypothetical protein, partial [Limosilactobacillus reuteri]|uniref:hypothetical protein n=1 Tax=Limosilactobacillus reuteri TaxID=1598 RepID=UPI002B054CC9
MLTYAFSLSKIWYLAYLVPSSTRLNVILESNASTSGVSEGVKLISGAQIKQLAGSSISVHDNGWA